MKRCPRCHQTYTDDSLSFCLEDGTPLVRDTGGHFNSQATLVSPSPDTSPQRPGGTNPAHSNRSAPGWSQPTIPQYAVPPQQKRSLLPWILGGAAVLLLGLVGLGAIAALVLSSSGSNRNRIDVNAGRPANSKSTSNSKSARTSNDDSSSNNSNSSETSYAAREGHYVGTATNTTNSPASTGDAVIDITEVSDTTGTMKMKMKFSNGLCGEGDSYGVIDKSTGETALFGTLISSGSDCPSLTWVMTSRCTFGTADTLTCTYSLTSVGQTPQAGSFEVAKQ